MAKFMLIEYKDILQILFQGLKYTLKKYIYIRIRANTYIFQKTFNYLK